MQYPIIDNLISAYLLNGWTGLDIPETIDINYYQEGSGNPSPDNIRPIYPGTIININGVDVPVYGGTLDSNNLTLTITKKAVNLGTLTWYSEDTAVSGLARVNDSDISSLDMVWLSRPVSSMFVGLYPTSYSLFMFNEIGESNRETVPFLRARSYDFIGKTGAEIKSIVNNQYLVYEINNPEIYNISSEEVAKYINSAFSNDIAHRLKLPLPHYFPHPVIDSLKRASDGTMTNKDREILTHYLTPLGIGGI